MTDETDIQFLSDEDQAAVVEAEERRCVASLEVHAAASAKIGPFLDIIERVAEAVGLQMTLSPDGYVRTFYGWEEDIWRAE